MYKLPHTLLRITFVCSIFYHMKKQMSQSSNKRTPNGTHHLLTSHRMGRKSIFFFSIFSKRACILSHSHTTLNLLLPIFIWLLKKMIFYPHGKFPKGQMPINKCLKTEQHNQQTFWP
jgi:hypothetical protein